jgi:hypothetical protein
LPFGIRGVMVFLVRDAKSASRKRNPMNAETVTSPATYNGRTITRAYWGRQGCMCGCRGEYTAAPDELASAAKRFEELAATGFEVEADDDGSWVAIDTENRTAVLYLAP